MRATITLATLLVAIAATATNAATTLRRPYDPVEISTGRLAEFPSRETRHFRLYRFTGTMPVAIRHQFDPRDAKGDVVVGGPAEFTFDEDDVLVFMARDAGDHAAPAVWPLDWTHVAEIEIVDPRADGGRAWAYLVWFDGPPHDPPLAPYVRIDGSARHVSSDAYQVEYADGRDFFTGMQLVGADGTPSPNLLRQSRMRGSPTFSLFFKRVTLDFTEENTLVAVEGVRAGPVRVVRRARLTIDLGTFFPQLPGGVADTYHYASAFVTPSRVHFSSLILHALRDFSFEDLLEFAPSALPLQYFDRTHLDGVLVANGDRETHDDEDHEWWAYSNGAGTMLHTFVIPERWQAWGVRRGTLVRPAADEAHGSAAIGYTLEDMIRLREAGTWDFNQMTFALSRQFHPGDEEDALAMVHTPLAVEVRFPSAERRTLALAP